MKEYIIVKEGLLNSIISDLVSFGILFGLLYLNYTYLGNSLLIKSFICLLLLVIALGRGSKQIHRFKTKEEAIKFLEEN